LWKSIAFAARYGSQPPTALLGRALSIVELVSFNDAIAEILTEEGDAVRNAANS
jgi:hypothetical protein